MSGAIDCQHRLLRWGIHHERNSSGGVRKLAGGGCCPRGHSDRGATRRAAGGLGLPATLWSRLLLRPTPQPCPPPLPTRAACRSDCTFAPAQSVGCLGAAGSLLQGGRPGRPSPPTGTLPRQTLATLGRTHCPLPAPTPRRHTLGPPRLHPRHPGRFRLAHGLAQLPHQVRLGRRGRHCHRTQAQ
jgi:hypothetical protein